MSVDNIFSSIKYKVPKDNKVKNIFTPFLFPSNIIKIKVYNKNKLNQNKLNLNS